MPITTLVSGTKEWPYLLTGLDSGTKRNAYSGHVKHSGSKHLVWQEPFRDNVIILYKDNVSQHMDATEYTHTKMVRGTSGAPGTTGGAVSHATAGGSQNPADSAYGHPSTMGWWLSPTSGRNVTTTSHSHGNTAHDHTTSRSNLDHIDYWTLRGYTGGDGLAHAGAVFLTESVLTGGNWSLLAATYDDHYLKLGADLAANTGTTHHHGSPPSYVLNQYAVPENTYALTPSSYYRSHRHNWAHQHTSKQLSPAGLYLGAYETDEPVGPADLESGTIILLTDTDIPSGFTRYTDLDDKMVVFTQTTGSWATAFSSADTHTHDAQSGSSDGVSNTTTRPGDNASDRRRIPNHTHAMASHNHGNSSSIPEYVGLYAAIKT